MQTIANKINDQFFGFTSFIDETKPKGVRVNLPSLDICNYILNNNYSATTFKYNRRKKSNAQKTKIIILDIDEPQGNYPTINDLRLKIKDLNHVLATTKSHQKLKNGVVCDRYRLLIFLSEDVENTKHYSDYVAQISNHLNLKHDCKCIDLGRLFFRSVEILSMNLDGQSFVTVRPNSITPPVLINKKLEYRMAECELPPEILKWVNKKELGQRIVNKREVLIRILICQKYLLTHNDLSLEFISNYLGIKRDTLKNWFDDLIKHGWLSIFSNDYGKGWKSKSYSAQGELAKVIMEYHGYKTRRDCYGEIALPVSIKDGEWNEVLFQCSFKFSLDDKPDIYINWVKTIDGWDKKTRLIQAHNSFKHMKKFILEQSKK